MEQSILKSIKKVIGVSPDYTVFDLDILIYINAVFGTLNELGIGPVEGFMIEDETPVWDAFLSDDNRLNAVKTYMGLRVRMLFDPPATSYTQDAMKEQIKELEWRLNVIREYANYPLSLNETVLDGGSP